MFQSAGSEIIDRLGEAVGVPIYRQEIIGTPKCTSMEYKIENNDEIEDLFLLLSKIKVNIF